VIPPVSGSALRNKFVPSSGRVAAPRSRRGVPRGRVYETRRIDIYDNVRRYSRE